MSYIVQEPSNFINIKLTDTGRRLLSLGALTFNNIIFSDREVNYYFGRNNNYDICRNRVLSPKDDHPSFYSFLNFDGSSIVPVDAQTVTSARQMVTAMTNSVGFFTGGSYNWEIKTDVVDGEAYSIGTALIDYSTTIPSGSTEINLTIGSYTPKSGDLVYVPWEPPQYSAITNSSKYVFSGRPNVSLWYRVKGITGSTIEVDRAVPNFGSTAIPGSGQKINAYFYPYGQVETTYGSATTVNCGVWNMNIVRTSSEIGTTPSMSGYTTYGSIEYNGTKQYLGFGSETKNFGIIHYTNKYSGNTYAEQLVPTTVKLEIPNIMWHRNYSVSVGQEMNYGLTLYDYYGSDYFDPIAMTTYRNLMDGVSSNSYVVGRVYHKLKLIVITDQELLTTLTYKSNRNYTLPELNLSLSPSIIGSLSGFCKNDYVYYVTYLTSSNKYGNGESYGYPQCLPCSYISIISGSTDSATGLGSVLRANFSTLAFPFLRSSSNLSTLSGTGWNANSVQLLVQEYPISASTTVSDLPTNQWKIFGDGSGKYTGETGSLTISPSDLQSHVFNLTQEDYASANTYSLDGAFSAFTTNVDTIYSSGLTFGNESFFYANLTTGIQANVFKSNITIFARNDEYNSSTLNTTFDSLYNDSTFITEIGILNSNKELVAVAKPAYPIKKNSSRYLAFQLELDF